MDALTYYKIGLSYSVLNVTSKDANLAIHNFEKASQLGHSDAYYLLSRAYSIGEGVSKNLAKALEYSEIGIRYGSAKCKFSWAILMLRSEEAKKLPIDFLQESYEKIVEEVMQEDPLSYHILATFYYNGIFVEKNIEVAILNYEISAQMGYSDSQYALGEIYEQNKEFEKSLKYYQLAANQRHIYAVYTMGTIMLERNQLSDAKHYLDLSCQENYPPAYRALASYYSLRGELTSSYKCLHKGATLNDIKSMYELGVYYHRGTGTSASLSKSIYWLLKARDEGYSEAMYYLGVVHKGENVKSYEYFLEAANLNHAKACFNIGLIFQDGRGVIENVFRAFFWYKKAAELDHVEAMYHLGFFYYHGYGITINIDESNFWWKRAAEFGHTKAKEIMVVTKEYERVRKSED